MDLIQIRFSVRIVMLHLFALDSPATRYSAHPCFSLAVYDQNVESKNRVCLPEKLKIWQERTLGQSGSISYQVKKQDIFLTM